MATSSNWERLLESLAAAHTPTRGNGMGDLVNALVFASRASADPDAPHFLQAQTATSELVEQIAWLADKSTLDQGDIRNVVDYIVMTAELPPLTRGGVAV